MEKDFLVISDIHLEKKNLTQQNFILDSINEKLLSYQDSPPILICAGDIHNGTKALPWLEKIKTKVIYLCGNHEFWENDYNEVISGIRSSCPENVTFLHNDFVVIDNILFLGGTLWSDIGESLNPDIIHESKWTMNDNFYITNKKWYEQEENINKIKNFYINGEEQLIEKKSWNVLIEREENKKTIQFYNDFIEVFDILKQISNIENNFNYALNSKSDYFKIDKKTYNEKLKKLKSYLFSNDFKKWLDDNHTEFRPGDEYLLKFNLQKEMIFNRLKGLDLSKLKLVMVSHHLPFLEERLIGNQEKFERKSDKLFNELPDSIYSLRKGLNYPYINYFWRIQKGEMNKEEAINQIVHYNNDGSANFPRRLMEEASYWIHGHEHSYNYEGMLKGIKIATNPFAYSMDVFKFDKGQVELGAAYKNYHNINDEVAEINKLKNSFLRKVKMELTKKEMGDSVDLWTLKNFSWETYTQLYNYTEKLNNKLLRILLKNNQFNNLSEKESMNIKVLMNAIDFSIENLNKMEEHLNEAATIRKDIDYSFNTKYGNALQLQQISSYFKVLDESLHKFNYNFNNNPNYEYDSWINSAFFNISLLQLNKKELIKTKLILDKFQFEKIQDINSKFIKIFHKAFENKKRIFAHEFRNNVSSKLYKLKNKYKKEGENNSSGFFIDNNF